MIPAETVPDGSVALPHHFYLGIMVAVWGFAFVWPYYPVVGSSLTLVGTLVMVDDVVSHVFGVWTPLDWLWHAYLLPVMA